MIKNINSSVGDFQITDKLSKGLIFKSEEMNWSDAMNVSQKMGEGWRLPTFDEFSVLQNETTALDDFSDEVFWTYDEYEENTECAYIYDLHGVLTGHWNKDEDYCVIAIRIL